MTCNRDLKSNIDVVQSLPPLQRTAAGTGAGVDLMGYDGAMIEWSIGTSSGTLGTNLARVDQSDNNSTWTATATTDLLGTFTAVTGTAGENTVQRVGYIGTSRYVRGVMAITATGTANHGINVVRGYPAQAPLA